jgi:hypothetical protein
MSRVSRAAETCSPCSFASSDLLPLSYKAADMAHLRDSLFVAVVILVLVIATYYITRYLHGVVTMDAIQPVNGCLIWLERQRDSYLSTTDPKTGQLYTKCAAVNQAILDSQLQSNSHICPRVDGPPSAARPYDAYMTAWGCARR